MRIYGKKKHLGYGYWEVEYKEYRNDGTLKATGTEDFSAERWNKQTHRRFVYTWDGMNRNKGGYRMFDYNGAFVTDDPKAFKKYMQALHADAALVEIRTR